MLCVGIYLFRGVANFYDDHIKRKDYDYSRLPPHIIAKILSHLTTDDFRNASEACKSWYYASSDPRVTKNITVSFGIVSTSCEFLARPINSVRFDMVDFNKLNYRKILRKFGERIVDIEINSKFTFTQLFELFIYLPNVRTLKILHSSKYVSPTNFHRSKKIAKYKSVIIRNLAQIKKLDIWTEVQNLELFRLFLTYCCNLEALYWSNSDELPKEECDSLFNYLLDPIENVVLYKVNDLRLENIDRKQNSKFFEKMIRLDLRNLKKLSLSEISTTYYDTMFKEFCKTYNFLDSFTMGGCNENQLNDICKYMNNLRCCTLNSCTANNLSELLKLKKLEKLHIDRVDVVVHDDLLVLLQSEHKLLKKLHLNDIDSHMLQLICENFKNLVDLSLEDVHTKDCEPIFRNMMKLKKLNIGFTESTKVNSRRIRSSDRYNITNLTELEHVYVSCFVPGITPELLEKLPKIKKGWEFTWDPTDDEQATIWDELVMVADTENDLQEENLLVDIEEINLDYNITDFNWCQELIL